MNNAVRLGFVLLSIVAVAAATSLVTSLIVKNHPDHDHHYAIHKALGITPEQDRALIPVEERYAHRVNDIKGEIRLANAELAEAILADRQDSPRVQAALTKIKDAQGKLQQATLEHCFEMQPHLRPEQYQKLLDLTANALYSLAE